MYSPSREDLNHGLEAVGYEIDRPYKTFILWTNENEDRDRGLSYLEALLLHVRNLWEFYTSTSKKGHEDTMLCTDYNIQHKKLSSHDHLDGSAEYEKRLHRWLAHLSYLRPLCDRPGRNWPVRRIFLQLTDLSMKFSKLLLECYPFDGQTINTKEKTWQTRKTRLRRLIQKYAKEPLVKGFTDSGSIASEIDVEQLD